MGPNLILQGSIALLLITGSISSPRLEDESFTRSSVETIPKHDPIPQPIRASVESVPLRNRRDEGDMRLPLRDAVEKRPIQVIDPETLAKAIGTSDSLFESIENIKEFKEYYGAASYLNNSSRSTDERLQLGNANLQEMQQTVGGPTTRRLVVCYLESWAAYRAPPLAYTAGLVPRSCTHLHYAFAVLHPHNYAVIPANEDYDMIKGGYRIATGLKRRISGLKVMISIGGEGTERLFSEMVQEPYTRNSFIDSALNFLQEHDFDGLDLHWIYAGDRDEKEKELLTTLLYELREKFSPYGYLLSTVLPPFRYQIEDGYDLSAVSGATDYTILQAWDMTHGKRDDPPTKAVQHSALHRDPGASSRDQRYDNIEFMVKYILRHGMAADKLVLGIPLYGRSYTLEPSTLPAPGAAVSGWGDEGPYTQTRGLLAYFEICMAQREGKGTSGLDESGNSFAVFDNQWVTYDTPDTILEKMKFVISMDLAGAAAWAIDMDDFRGLCGSPYPIMSAISTTLNGESTQTDQSTLKIGACETEIPYLASDEESCAHFHFCTGGISYRMVCEDERLYDPSTGFCGHQDVTKCVPGQSLRISVEDAARFLSQAYETDYEWSKDGLVNKEKEELIESPDIKKSRDHDKRVVCYMTSWAFYRRGEGKFVPEHIDTRLCTHVVYAYSSLLTDDLVIKEFDPWADITNNLYERVTSLQDVKVLLGLGGWTDSAGDKYSRLVSSSAARTKFVVKAVSFLKAHNFKGLHLDWNYPVCWQSNCKKGAKSDKQNFAKLVQELSKALHAADMELGVALSGYREVIETAYDLPIISKAADFMSTMTYDYHGGWERSTAHHTPLIPAQRDALAYYSIEYAVKALIDGGADPKKLLLGLAFYGQSYRLADVEGSTGPGAPAAGPGEPGEFTKQPGMLSYYEICYRVKNLRWKTGRQDKAGPYAYSNNQWVGYDDPKSIREKVDWALGLGLGGVTAWAIDLDDFNNRCCMEPSPLLRAAGRALGRSVPAPPKSSCDRPPEPVTPAPPTTTPAESDGSIVSTSEHSHGSHEHDHTTKPTSTTWPSWKPPSTTAMTWWPQATTTSLKPTTTSTTTVRTTTTRRTTTRQPSTTTTTTKAPEMDTEVEGDDCEAGEYRAAPGDCEAYLQCEGGQWRKHRCAPGLHWSAKTGRCDWPSFAKCTEKPPSQASTATTTLAPMTSRPPPTTTRRTTTSRRTTTTTTTTTTTPKPKPSTTSTTTSAPVDDTAAGLPCSGQEYVPVPHDCNSYLHCDGSVWRLQHCAPGLHWSSKHKHCDWPKYAKCEGSAQKTTTLPPKTSRAPRPTRPASTTTTSSNLEQQEDGYCSDKEVYAPASTCDAYLLCVGGRWRKQLCPPGLHWDKRTNRCDWVDFAMCDVSKPTTTKRPIYQFTTTTAKTSTRRPTTTTRRPTTTTKKPYTLSEEYQKPTRCATGTYHTHPRCEKFYVCVNGVLVTQSCAPGLVWNQDRSQCDFPTFTSCSDRRKVTSAAMIDQTKLTTSNGLPDIDETEDKNNLYCENGQYDRDPTDCTRYRHCLFGKFEEFSCSAGLHWNQEKQICDWPQYAKCKKRKVTTTTPPPLMDPIVIASDIKPEAPIKPIESSPTSVEIFDPSSRPPLLKSPYKLVCYYTNWSWYRPGLGKYGPEDIDPTLCTHIVFGFAVLGPDGLITPHDPWADQENRLYERVVEFKKYGIKVSLALGGWNDSVGDKYSKLVNDPEARRRFVKHALEFIETYGFDGLDLDWEYPKCWQVDCSMGPDSDKEGFADLVRELSAIFKPKGLLLSSAVSPSKRVIDEGYDVPVLARHLDWIAVMTYDYHGQWDKKTGHVAPLHYHPDDDNTYFNANYTIRYWMEKGAPSSKLVMGMPMYGQTFTTMSSYDINSLNVPALSGGDAGEYTRAKGFLAYYEICERIKERRWKVVKDPLQRMGPFAYKGNQWVSFDDVDIIKNKVNFIKSLNLAGGMVWALDLDDFNNRCNQGKYPLLNAIKKGLLDSSVDYEPLQPVTETSNQIDEDLEDIEVRPSYTKPKPTTAKPIEQTTPLTTTKKPVPPIMDEEERFKIVCYFTNWAYYRPGSGKYTPNDIDPSQCTHIVYAFAVLDSNKLEIKPYDSWLDVENKFYEKVVALKNQGVRVLLGLGGWKDSAGDKYSRLVNSPAARRKFIVHAIDFIEQYEFDGLDLDWNYPKCWQVDCNKGPNSDKEGFALLIKELRSAFVPRGLLLSAAVSDNKEVIDAGYDIPVLGAQLDWIALMTYDYHGQWDKKTGHVAPMYSGSEHGDESFSVNFTVNYWIEGGAPREKLIVGIPFYGQSFSLYNEKDNGLGAPTYAGGDPGDETRARGFLAFYEICDRIRTGGWNMVQDPTGRMGPYATWNDQWVSFDDDSMVRHKAHYVSAMGLGGTMVWTLDLDDFTGQYCGCGRSPLLANINHVLRGQEEPQPCSLEEIVSPTTPKDPEKTTTEVFIKPEVTTELTTTSTTTETDDHSGSNDNGLAGKACSGISFKADDHDCSKYYLCLNGEYIDLTCPAPLVWNKNHCDWPEKARCKGKVNLRLTEGETEDKPIIACYFTNWAYYRPSKGKFGPEQVDASLCTHIIYAWAHLNSNTSKLTPGIPELDVDNDFLGKISELRLEGVKVILGVGGLQNSQERNWSAMASNRESRNTFVQSALSVIKKWKFDGLHLAWQYPVCEKESCADIIHRSNDRNNFNTLLSELSKSFRQHNLELSAAVSPNIQVAAVAYDPEVLTATLDWMSIAANDYYGSKKKRTEILLPFKTGLSSDTYDYKTILAYWSDVVPVRQLVMSIPAYGRTYTLRNELYAHAGSPSAGAGDPGNYTQVRGFMAYYEICNELRSQYWEEIVKDEGTFAVHRSQWVTYLRPTEVFQIASTSAKMGLRGAALWALDLDDWRSECSCEPWPLLTALRQGIFEPNISSTLC